jgi:hypothetical protein
MHRHNQISKGTKSSLDISINKGVELLLRSKKPEVKILRFGKWFLPFTNKEFTICLEIRER